jgi:hypothetical protein
MAATEERSGMDGFGSDRIGFWLLEAFGVGFDFFHLLKSLCAANVFSVDAWLAL